MRAHPTIVPDDCDYLVSIVSCGSILKQDDITTADFTLYYWPSNTTHIRSYTGECLVEDWIQFLTDWNYVQSFHNGGLDDEGNIQDEN